MSCTCRRQEIWPVVVRRVARSHLTGPGEIMAVCCHRLARSRCLSLALALALMRTHARSLCLSIRLSLSLSLHILCHVNFNCLFSRRIASLLCDWRDALAFALLARFSFCFRQRIHREKSAQTLVDTQVGFNTRLCRVLQFSCQSAGCAFDSEQRHRQCKQKCTCKWQA